MARGEDGPDPATPPTPETLVAQNAPATPDKPDEKAAKPAKPAIEYVENRGVVFRTPDGLFEASLGFNLQVRYTHVDLDAAAVDHRRKRVPGPTVQALHFRVSPSIPG